MRSHSLSPKFHSMKLLTLLPTALILCVSSASAQSASREKSIEKIESVYTRATIFSAESPFVAQMISPAKTVNLDVSQEAWADISREVAGSLSKIMVGKGGIMDMILRGALEPLSGDELSRLEVLLSDPVYIQFQREHYEFVT